MGSKKKEVTPSHDETAKQLLLQDSSDSDSSVSLEQQDQSIKKKKREKRVTEETDSNKRGKSKKNVDERHEETTEEKNSTEPVGSDDHKEGEKEVPKEKVEEGGGNKKDGIEEGEHTTSKNANAEKCKTLEKEDKSESEDEPSNTAQKVEMENHCKEEEELNKSSDCKEIKGEDKTAAKDTKENKPKNTWRRNKLLRLKLSETDSSEEERKWNARKKKEETDYSSDSPSGATPLIKRKKKRKFIVDSDSGSGIKSSSGSSDLEDLFDMKRKRKRKSESSDIDSRSSSSSSIEVKKKPKPKRRRVVVPTSESSGSDSEDLNSTQKSEGTPGKGRKNIRRVLKDENVADATKRAAREEEERKKRIAEKQKMYNELFLTDQADVEKLDKLVLDFDQETKEELVTVHKDIVKKLKPHQVKGVKFMWDTCFESIEQMKENKGTGCILAHCMGLGKTLQVIALVHTVLCHSATGMKTALIICPYSTIKNWVNEFHVWLKDLADTDEIEVYELTKYKKNYERIYQLKQWHEDGGVMVMGYEMYRNLAGNEKLKVRKHMKDTLQKVLVDPGPDLIVCDEGHLLKNENSAISKALRKIRTLRRIVLTGTPLQNNLNEYHCMVQFVKPNLLGTKKEFDNRFVNPIRNGQYVDSTLHDVKVMKRRAHVLHKMLESSVQRFDYAVLTPFLPPKMEYVISVRLSEAQVKLYRYYLDNFSAASELNDYVRGKGAKLFSDFQALQRIWTHPRVIRMDADRKEKEEERKQMMASDTEGSLVDFIAKDSTSDSDTSSNSSSVEEISNDDIKPSNDNDVAEITEKEEEKQNEPSSEWWEQFVTCDDMDDIRSSGKLMLLFYILQESEKIGDKVLVFSQSLLTLDLIEYFLGKIDEATQQSSESEERLGNFRGSWSIGLDYFRLDGSTSAENRNIWCKNFNKESNYRARLFLISTKAGGLGINLVAANRVVLFDASWNPSHDVQSIFRIYRFGQKKPCYVYRFLAQGTMEEKIYDRQVTKLSLSCRVVDEQQIERHYNMADLQEMYIFDPEQVSKRPIPVLPKDRLLAELLKEHEYWVITYHEHDSLLQNKEEEELNEEERKAAWEEYENEKQGKVPTAAVGFINQQTGMYQGPLGQFQLSLDPNNQMVGGTEPENYMKMLQQIQQHLVKDAQSRYFNTGHPLQPQSSMPFINKDGKTISFPYVRKEVTAVPSTSRAQPMIKVKDFGQMREIGQNRMHNAPLKTYGAPNQELQKMALASLLQPSVQHQHPPSDDSIEIID